MNQTMLIRPHGGKLVDLTASAEQQDELKTRARNLPSIRISERSVCDLQLLACGAFSPLTRFVGKADYHRILDEMRLVSGLLFPIPVTLPIERDKAIRLDSDVALRNNKNELLAILTIEEIYEWDVTEVSEKIFGTTDSKHPLISEMQRWGKLNLSGALRVVQLPRYYDFQDLRLTPAQVRVRLEALGRPNVVAFQTRN